MLKQFMVNVHLDGHYTIADPRCPSYWKGSGCYDIDIHSQADLEVEVWAETEDLARKYALEYEYRDTDSVVELDAVQVEAVKFVANLEDRDEEETGVIEPVNFCWPENEEYEEYERQ